MDELQALLDSLGLLDCTAEDMAGFGFAGCKKDKDRIVTMELTRAGFAYQGKSKAYIQSEQQKGNIVILQGVVSFEAADSTPTYDVRPGSGLNRLAGEVPGLVKVMFDNGMDFGNALQTLKSYGSWNLAVYDVTGAKFVVKTKSGVVKGISIGQIYPYVYKGGDGTKAPSTMLEFQFIDVTEEARQVRIDASELDFSATELNDVNSITLNIEPITAGTTIVFKPLLSDRTHLVPNLVITNFKVTKTTGATTTVLTPTNISYVTNPGKVTLTVPALVSADVITMQTNYVTTGKSIILVDDILYKSEVETAIVGN